MFDVVVVVVNSVVLTVLDAVVVVVEVISFEIVTVK